MPGLLDPESDDTVSRPGSPPWSNQYVTHLASSPSTVSMSAVAPRPASAMASSISASDRSMCVG
jgi:hypothetical protein